MAQTRRVACAPRLAVETIATPDSSRFLSDLIGLYLVRGVGLDPDAAPVAAFRLAVVEAVTNVHRHAYVGCEPGTVELDIRRDGDSLVAVLRDEGEHFDPLASGRGALPKPDELAEGGYGLGIVRRVMDSILHRRRSGRGNELTLVKKLW